MVKKNGEVIDVLLSAVGHRDETGQMTRTQAFIVDVTGRKREEKELRESEERFRSLYQNTPVMMHSIDLNGRLVSVNDHWLKVLGYTRSEVIGRKSIEFLTEASRIYATQVVFPEFFKGGGVTQDIQYQFVKKNGEVLDVLLSFVGERNESGELHRLSCFIIDVTDRKKAEKTSRELAVAEERNRLAREIHDTLAQSLIGIIIRLESAGKLLVREPEASSVEIQSARDLAQRSLDEARRSVWDLHSARRDSVDLTGAIRQAAANTAEDTLQCESMLSTVHEPAGFASTPRPIYPPDESESPS